MEIQNKESFKSTAADLMDKMTVKSIVDALIPQIRDRVVYLYYQRLYMGNNFPLGDRSYIIRDFDNATGNDVSILLNNILTPEEISDYLLLHRDEDVALLPDDYSDIKGKNAVCFRPI